MALGANHQELQLGSGDVRRIGAQRVYIRAPGEFVWTQKPGLYCTQAAFAISPTMPTATLVWYYGDVRDVDGVAPEKRQRLDLSRHFVKVEIDVDTAFPAGGELPAEPLVWYGVVDSEVDNQGGLLEPTLPTGQQQFTCYGMEQMLRSAAIDQSAWTPPGSTEPVAAGFGLTFNDGGKPNMSPVDTVPEIGPSYRTFRNDPDYDEQSNPNVLEYWNPLQILRYLVYHHVPLDKFGNQLILLDLDEASTSGAETAILPTDTRPVIETDGRSAYDILNELIRRSDLMAWSLVTEETETDTPGESNLSCKIKIHSLHSTEGMPVRNNPDTLDIIHEVDPLTAVTVERSNIDRYDIIFVRGPRRVSVFSTKLDPGPVDPTLIAIEAGWTAEQETEYSEAGTPTGDEDQKREKATAFRTGGDVENVFSLFRVGAQWEGEVISLDETTEIVFPTEFSEPAPPEDPEAEPEKPVATAGRKPYRGALRLLPTLPLLVDVKYSLPDYNKPLEEPRRDLFVAFALPTDPANPSAPPKYISGEMLQKAADLGDIDDETSTRMTVALSVVTDSQFRINVNGEPQHAIASTDYAPQAYDAKTPHLPWNNAIVTLAVEEDRFSEVEYTAADFGVPNGREYRTKVIYLPDRAEFRTIYVAPKTVSKVDASDGSLIYAESGFIQNGEGDDGPIASFTKMIGEYYVARRNQVTITTRRTQWMNQYLQPGALLNRVGQVHSTYYPPGYEGPQDPPVDIVANSVISEVVYDMPLQSAGDRPDAPMVRISTYAAELDPLSLLPMADDSPAFGNLNFNVG